MINVAIIEGELVPFPGKVDVECAPLFWCVRTAIERFEVANFS